MNHLGNRKISAAPTKGSVTLQPIPMMSTQKKKDIESKQKEDFDLKQKQRDLKILQRGMQLKEQLQTEGPRGVAPVTARNKQTKAIETMTKEELDQQISKLRKQN